ncbi:MAG: SurA N-terminal domain-containing protein, partial [Saprospiraceae bacterium]
MALIGTIRKNGWILIVLMTLALGGFILMEIISNAERNSVGDVNLLGKVNGTEIKRGEFDDYEKLVYANAKSNSFQVRGQMWDYFVERALVDQEAEALGLGVDGEELKDLEFGMRPSPIIADRFKNPDGQVNRQQLASIKGAIEGGQFTDPLNRAYWATQEKEIVKERLQSKIVALVSKGMYTPGWQAEMAFHETNERLDFVYVRIPYEKVKDDEAKPTDADYAAYLKQNPHLYDQTEETRLVDYVSFDVQPTAEDTLANRESVAKLVEGLRTAPNDSIYIVTNNGILENTYKAKAALPPSMADTLLQRPIGSVVGPYLDGGAWTIAKILDRKVVPDSARARHILISKN